VKALAAQLGLEVRTLQKRFDQHFGITPTLWIAGNQRAQQPRASGQKGQEVHVVSLHSTRLEGMYFFGNRPPHLKARPQNSKALPSRQASPPFEFLDSTANFSATLAKLFPCKE
jgi:methylphosphotriester-DNA--protein-cysteine methyltransferase